MNQDRPAFVVGWGAVTCHGVGRDALLGALMHERPCPRRGPPPALADFPADLDGAGWIEELVAPAEPSLRRTRFGRLDRASKVALLAARDASDHAEPHIRGVDPERAGIAVGTALGSHQANERYYEGLRAEGPAGASPALFTFTLPSIAAGQIAIALELKGPSYSFADGPCAGLHAVSVAAGAIARGEADLMLAGAVEVLSRTAIAACQGTGGQSTGGEVLAEAGVFVVLAARAAAAPCFPRVASSARGFGADARRTAAERLDVPDAARGDLRWARAADVEPTVGATGAAGPLLALCAALAAARGGLPGPLAVEAQSPAGDAEALLLLA